MYLPGLRITTCHYFAVSLGLASLLLSVGPRSVLVAAVHGWGPIRVRETRETAVRTRVRGRRESCLGLGGFQTAVGGGTKGRVSGPGLGVSEAEPRGRAFGFGAGLRDCGGAGLTTPPRLRAAELLRPLGPLASRPRRR